MASDDKLMRDHARITSLDELETAKKRAKINATQDRLYLQNSVGKLKTQGPQVILKNVVLPIVGVGLATYGVAKLVGALVSDDKQSSQYYREPHYDGHYDVDGDYATTRAAYAQPVYVQPPVKRRSNVKKLATYLPVAIKLSKMAVSYLEKNGTRVPSLVHDLLAGPGNSARQPVPPQAS